MIFSIKKLMQLLQQIDWLFS
jgi:hypothetical protein